MNDNTAREKLPFPSFPDITPNMARAFESQAMLLRKHEPLAKSLLEVFNDFTVNVEDWNGKKHLISFKRWISAGHDDLSASEHFGTDFLVACANTIEELKAEHVDQYDRSPKIGLEHREEYLEQSFFPTLAARITYNDMLRSEMAEMEEKVRMLNYRHDKFKLEIEIKSLRLHIDVLSQIVSKLDRKMDVRFGFTFDKLPNNHRQIR